MFFPLFEYEPTITCVSFSWDNTLFSNSYISVSTYLSSVGGQIVENSA